MSLTITYDGAVSDLVLTPGDRLWLWATDRDAAAVPIIYQGEPAALTVTLDWDGRLALGCWGGILAS